MAQPLRIETFDWSGRWFAFDIERGVHIGKVFATREEALDHWRRRIEDGSNYVLVDVVDAPPPPTAITYDAEHAELRQGEAPPETRDERIIAELEWRAALREQRIRGTTKTSIKRAVLQAEIEAFRTAIDIVRTVR